MNLIQIQCYFFPDLTHLSGLHILKKKQLTYSNPEDLFFTQEFFYFNKRTILLNNNIGGEVSMHSPDLVTWLQIVWTVDSSFLFPYHLSTQSLFFSFPRTEFYTNVIEDSLQGAPGALHNNCVSLQSGVDMFWNVDSLIAENGLHPCKRRGKERTSQ